MKPKHRPAARLLASLLAASLFCWCLPQAAGGPEPGDGAALVRQLGHAKYTVREEAAAQLGSLGLAVQQDLLAGLKADDPEVRRRCARILVHVLQTDYQRRVAALLAGGDDEEHNLPGWSWYRGHVGSHEGARRLLAAMLSAEPGLLLSAEQGPARAEEAFKLRLIQLQQQMTFPNQQLRRQPDMESIAALLLVAVHPQWRLPGQLVDNSHLVNLTRQGGFATALNEGPYREAIRRLVGRWILVKGVPNMAQQKLRLALQFRIPEGLPLAIAMLDEADGQAPNMAVFAAEAVARLGGAQYAATLLPLLEDERQCARSGQRVIQVRDVVLAWLVYTTGQDIEAYGQPALKNWFQTIVQNPAVMFNFSQFGYDEPERREQALQEWSEWLKANPLPTPPDVGQALVTDRPAGQPDLAQPPADAARASIGGLSMADRSLVRSLQQAERLAELREYSAAARLLGQILSSESDFVFRPDRDVPLYRHLKPAAEHALGSLPPEGLETYQLLFGPEARRRLERAVADGDRQELAKVSQDYFYTDAGAEAAYLLGASYWQAGQFFSAAACWQRLVESGDRVKQFEPALSIQLAACWLATGESQRIPRRLEQLKSQFSGKPIEMAGRRENWFDRPDDALRWLVALLKHEPAADEVKWSVFRGRPSRNPVAEGGSPYLVADPIDAPERSTILRQAMDRVRGSFFGRRRAALPALYPLVIDKTIVVRTATRIRAVHIETGELLWEASPDDPLADLLAESGLEKDDLAKELLPTELLNRLWQNPSHGTFSSDGHSVFAIEGLPLQGLIGPQRMVVRCNGARYLDPSVLGQSNVLAAYDLTSGKLRWEVGGPCDDDRRVLAGASFLGPPLPLGASLYCVAEIGDQTVLLVLDSATGALQWQRVLTIREEADTDHAVIRIPGLVVPRVRQPSRSNGASPSYADGILVCPVADGQVAAVDLTTRSVTWLYEGEDDLSGETLAERRMRLAQSQSHMPFRPPTDRWSDFCATIAEGHVLFTPPDSEHLTCLRLADGVRQWVAPRGDGLYVGAVHGGVVVVVGRSGVRGLRLADGEPAWESELALPPGAVPSGRGFLSNGMLYVPLSTAEVMGIDAESGRMAARSRSPAGIVPGNLVGLGKSVVSQSVDGLWRFDLIADREQLAAHRIGQNANDAAAWAERGELLLCDGRIAEAIECLSRAQQLEPTGESQYHLARAITDGLWTDYQRFRPLAQSLEMEEMEPGLRASVLRAVGWGAQRAGDRATALDTYLQLARIDPAADTLESLSAAVRVRRDRWLAARLNELLHDAADDETARLKPRLSALSNEARVRYLPFRDATVDAWLRTGAELAAGADGLAAEQRLRAALWLAQPDERPEGVARLAELLRTQGRAREALPLFARLAGPLAERVCLDGRTGRELVEALPADDPARPGRVAGPLWPTGELKAAAQKANGQHAVVYHAPVRVKAVDPRFDLPANVRVENVGRSLFGYDDFGRQTWELPLRERLPNIGFRNSHYLAEGAQLGHILVVWLVTRVCAVDLSGEKPHLLWDHPTTDLGGSDPRHRHRIHLANQRRAQQQRGGRAGGDSSPLVVAHGYACFERNEELVAVDLHSGETLWARDDVAENVDLFGDARYVFVAPADGNDEVRVLSALDGGELGRRSLPARAGRLATVGRRILVWEENAQDCQVRLIDPWSNETVWRREMAPGTQVCMVRPNGIAALDPEGWFAVLRTDSGEPMMETKLDVQPQLEQIHVETFGADYLIVANRPPDPAVRRVIIHTPIPAVNVHGSLHCVSAEGALRWTAEVLDQQLELDLPPELPVLLLSKRRQHRIPRPEGGFTSRNEYALLCLDKRTGRTILDETVQTHGQEMEIRAVDPRGGLIEVMTRPMSIRITRVK